MSWSTRSGSLSEESEREWEAWLTESASKATYSHLLPRPLALTHAHTRSQTPTERAPTHPSLSNSSLFLDSTLFLDSHSILPLRGLTLGRARRNLRLLPRIARAHSEICPHIPSLHSRTP